ncbi:MAG: PD40 domain-containing protein [Solirubrobacterales bacterium]|nr:PD40 domain-containing protein [Solirubrobacterales bacterium]
MTSREKSPQRPGRNVLRAVVAALTATVVMIVGVGTAEATFPGGNGPIVFSSDRGGSQDIFKVNANGTGQVQLTSDSGLGDSGTNTAPTWSQDRSTIAFVSDRDGNADLWLMNADGSAQQRITDTAAVESDPAFSPDNTKLVYASNADGDRDLYVLDLTTLEDEDGPTITKITNNNYQDYNPDWSPSGDRIIYERYAGGVGSGRGYQIFSVSPTGGPETDVSQTSYVIENGNPSFNGDGTKITFQRRANSSSNWEIYTMNADGSNAVKRTNTPTFDNTQPVFAPSGVNGDLDQGVGEKIAFVSNRTGAPQVFTMNVNGSSQTRISDGVGSDSAPNWQALDIFPPDTTITVGPDEGSVVTSSNVGLEFESTEEGSTFECRLDAGANPGSWEDCNTPHDTGAQADGQYTFNVRAIDPSGNVDPSPATRSFVIDTTPPVVDLHNGPRGPWDGAFINFVDTTIEFSSPENDESNVIAFECRLDPVGDDPETEEDETTPWSSCDDGSFELTDLSEGEHTVQVRGTDPWGNVSDPVNATFTVDLTLPTTDITDGPAEGFWSNDNTPTWEFEADEPATYECRVTDSADSDWASCSSPFTPSADLGDGPHTFMVRATDRALNLQDPVTERLINIDTTPPNTTITSGPDGETINVDQTSYAFESDQPEDATFECNFNGGGWEPCTSPFESAVLDNDEYTFSVRSTDRAGNLGPAAGPTNFTVYAPPRTVITSGPAEDSFVPTGNVSFDFTSEGANPSEDVPTFECRVNSTDDNDWEACSSPLNVAGLNNGEHFVQVRAIGEGNRPDLTPATRHFTVDKVRPETTIVSGPEEGSLTNDPTFVFESTEPGTFECEINGGSWDPCESGVAISAPDGVVNLQVRAVDRAGNEDATPATRSFTLDTTPPDTTIDSGPADGSRTKDTTVEFGFSSSEPTDATFECKVDDGEWASCESPIETEELADGEHTFAVRSTDAANNTDPNGATTSFTVDTVPPVATISTENPAEGAPTNDNQPAFEFESDKAGSIFQCRFNEVGQDEAEWQACTSPAQPDLALADGDYVFQVKAIDDVGNEQVEPASRAFTVDTTAPTTTIDAGPAEGSTIEVNHASFEFSSSEEGSTFECSLTAAADPDDFASCESPFESGALDDGAYTFKVRSTDPAGNLDNSGAVVNFTVDAPPLATILNSSDVQDGGRTKSTTPNFEFESNENDSTFECRVDSTDDQEWQVCASPFTAPALNDGSHTFEVRAVDPLDRTNEPAKATFTVDTALPVADITGGPEDGSYIASDSVEFTFVSSKENSTFVCAIDGGPFDPCTSPTPLTGLTEGEHTFSVKAIDDVSNEQSPPSTVTYNVDLTAPVSTIDVPTEAQAFTTNQPEFEFSADEPATFECQVDDADWASCESPFETDELDDGSHTFSVRATDRAGNVEVAPIVRNFTTEAPPRVILESGIENDAITNQADQTFEFTSTESGSTFECRLDETTWDVCSSPATFSSLSEGSHSVEIRALAADPPHDASLKPVKRTFTVDLTKPTSSFSSGPANGSTITVDSATLAFDADEAGSTFECKIDGGDWIDCESPVALTDLDEGPHSVSIRATDRAGNVQDPVTTRSFTVDTTPPVTTITSGPEAGAVINDKTPTLEFESDEPGVTFECKVDDGAWNGCTSPFTTSELADGAHTVSVRGTDEAGLVETSPVSRSFSVDTAAPTATITAGPQGLTKVKAPSFSFSADKPSTFECRVDDGAFAACTSPTTTSELADGLHTFRVKATDGAGNESSVASRQFTVDTAAPTVTIVKAPADSEQTSATVEFSSENGASFQCSLDQGAFAACTSPQTYSGLAVGAHSIAIKATDEAGNEGSAVTASFEVLKPKAANLARVTVKGPKKVKGGKKLVFRAMVKNNGDAAAGNVKVCAQTPKRLVKGAAKRCVTIKTIAPGKTGVARFTVKTKKVKRNTRANITVSAPMGASKASGGKRSYRPLIIR